MSGSFCTLSKESRWIPCPGCSGEIGVPAAYPADYPDTKAASEAQGLLDGSRTPVNNR